MVCSSISIKGDSCNFLETKRGCDKEEDTCPEIWQEIFMSYYCEVLFSLIYFIMRQYTPKILEQIATQTDKSVFSDYAFLLSYVQSWTETKQLAEKRQQKTNDFFCWLHDRFLVTSMTLEQSRLVAMSVKENKETDDEQEFEETLWVV